jgi:transketolase
MVYLALKAARILDTQEISATVMNMHTVRPLDTAAVDSVLDKQLIVSVEEHSVIGGLGDAVAEYKSRLRGAPEQLFLD